MHTEQNKINKHGDCPVCSHSWDGGSIAEHLIQQKASGVIYWADKSDDLIREIVKDDFGSKDARYSRLIMSTDNSEAKCPDCNHIFPKPVFVSNDLSYTFFNTRVIKREEVHITTKGKMGC
jgi:hypothetical protein